MESFLQNREQVASDGVKIVGGDPVATARRPGAGSWASLRQDEPVTAPEGEGAGPPTLGKSAKGEPSVRPVMEGGRVTALVVTCTCGKTTEIALEY